jgi:hypothetical protein
LKIWFCRKFNLPFKHPVVESYRPEEMFVEFWIDRLKDDPNADMELDMSITTSGDVQFVTGDPLIDALEARAAKGEKVDFVKELLGEKKLLPQKDKASNMEAEMSAIADGFDDSYTKG